MFFYKSLNEFKSSTGYDIEGQWYPRVTSIVSIKAKPALYKFYADQVNFDAAESIKNQSAQEGTLIHETIEGLLTNDASPVPPQCRAIADAFLDFRNQYDIVPHQIETRIISREHQYAGTIDVLAEVNGKLGVLDIKTSTGIYRDYGIQTAAYVQALAEEQSMPDLTRWILRLDQARACLNKCGAMLREKGGSSKIKNGTAKNQACAHVWGEPRGIVEFKELQGFQSDFKAFLAAKTLWEWEHEYWLGRV